MFWADALDKINSRAGFREQGEYLMWNSDDCWKRAVDFIQLLESCFESPGSVLGPRSPSTTRREDDINRESWAREYICCFEGPFYNLTAMCFVIYFCAEVPSFPLDMHVC